MNAVTKIVVALVAMTALFLAPGVAAAHQQEKSDGDDSPSAFDVRRAVFDHDESDLVIRVSTFAEWSSSDLSGRNNWFTAWVGTKNDGDFVVTVDYKRGRLRSWVSEPGEDGKRVGKATVRRSSSRTFVVKVSRDTVHAQRSVKWFAISSWDGDDNCCLDYMPGGTQYSGRYFHAL